MGKNKKKRSEKSNTINNVSIYENIIQKFVHATKSTGLVIGTNSVLRLLQKRSLSVVFLFSKKATPAIFHSLTFFCKTTNVPLITLQENDQAKLGAKFPTSITYGIKKEFMSYHPELEELLKNVKIPIKRKAKSNSCLATNLDEEAIKLNPNYASPVKEIDDKIYYHKKHKRVCNEDEEESFLAFSSITDNDDFPSYESHKRKKLKMFIK